MGVWVGGFEGHHGAGEDHASEDGLELIDRQIDRRHDDVIGTRPRPIDVPELASVATSVVRRLPIHPSRTPVFVPVHFSDDPVNHGLYVVLRLTDRSYVLFYSGMDLHF